MDGNGSAGALNDLGKYQPVVLPSAATPDFHLEAGSYASAQMLTTTDVTPGATIYYTTDGSAPSVLSTVYVGGVTVSSSETISAIAVANRYTPSPLAIANYVIR